MNKQEAINRIRYRIDTASEIAGKGEDSKVSEDLEMAIEALKKPSWIPVSERLPEPYGEYLCCDKYGSYIVGYPYERLTDDSYYVENEHGIMYDVIAWMPLPEPYRESD